MTRSGFTVKLMKLKLQDLSLPLALLGGGLNKYSLLYIISIHNFLFFFLKGAPKTV
jgi:hypothetical protein